MMTVNSIRGRFAIVLSLTSVFIVGVLSGCSAGQPAGTGTVANSATAPSASGGGSGAPTATAATTPQVTVAFTGYDAATCLTFESPLVLHVKIDNAGTGDVPQVGWLIGADPFAGGVGPHGVLAATLESQDGTGAWVPDELLQEHDEAQWVTHDLPATYLGHGQAVDGTYRLTLRGVGNDGGTTTLRAFVVDLHAHAKLAEATESLCVKM
jgi:hypothetical protein